jgi:hypothetical protein
MKAQIHLVFRVEMFKEKLKFVRKSSLRSWCSKHVCLVSITSSTTVHKCQCTKTNTLIRRKTKNICYNATLYDRMHAFHHACEYVGSRTHNVA